MDSIIKEHKNNAIMLWAAILNSGLVFGFLVYGGYLKSATTETGTGPIVSNDFDIVMYLPYLVAIMLAVFNILHFKSSFTKENIKSIFDNTNIEDHSVSPKSAYYGKFPSANDSEKKMMFFLGKILKMQIFKYAINEAIAIMGVVGIFCGGPEMYAYICIAVHMILMAYMFPKQEYIQV